MPEVTCQAFIENTKKRMPVLDALATPTEALSETPTGWKALGNLKHHKRNDEHANSFDTVFAMPKKVALRLWHKRASCFQSVTVSNFCQEPGDLRLK